MSFNFPIGDTMNGAKLWTRKVDIKDVGPTVLHCPTVARVKSGGQASISETQPTGKEVENHEVE